MKLAAERINPLLHTMRLFILAFLVAIALMLPFLLWNDTFMALFGSPETLARYGKVAWIAGIVLLVLDLALPVPGSAVMAGLGFLYGPVLGGLIGSAGSVLSGLLAYGLCRKFGYAVARRIAGETELQKSERLFAHSGGWIVALSRWLPLLPEVIACLAGLARMPFRNFALALGCGSVPMAFAYAAVGSAGVKHPAVALTASILIPPLLWLVVGSLLRRRMRGKPPMG
jgi:uncharacterized membrane protein YdjX (TVP38/TMEM64 family)